MAHSFNQGKGEYKEDMRGGKFDDRVLYILQQD